MSGYRQLPRGSRRALPRRLTALKIEKETDMALISCPECGKRISDKAEHCPSCGCPIRVAAKTKKVAIALPNTNVIAGGGLAAAFLATDALISTGREILWEGHHGATATFEINKPTQIAIHLGRWSNTVERTVEPGKRYQLVQDMHVHWLATFRLSEVDVIDFGL